MHGEGQEVSGAETQEPIIFFSVTPPCSLCLRGEIAFCLDREPRESQEPALRARRKYWKLTRDTSGGTEWSTAGK